MTEKKTRKQGESQLRTIAAAGCFFLFLLCPHNFSAPNFEVVSPQWTGFTAEALDPSDDAWDVRDRQNKPVTNPIKKEEIRLLFAAAMVDLLVIRDLPIASAAKLTLDAIKQPIGRMWNRAHKWFCRQMEVDFFYIGKRLAEKIALPIAAFLISLMPSLLMLRILRSSRFTCRFLPLAVPARC